MIAQIESLPLEDKPQEKKELFKHAIFAFERLRIKEMSQELADAVFLMQKNYCHCLRNKTI